MTSTPDPDGKPSAALVRALERLSTTRLNLVLGLGCDWLTGLGLCAAALALGDLRALPAALIATGGLLMFSWIEYAAHRWLFHGPIGPFRAGHVHHHQNPLGYDALPFFLPPLFMGALAALFMLALPRAYALLLAGGVAIGYAIYGSAHVVVHVHRFQGRLLRHWQSFHDIHHHHPETNFGVTTGLWDVMLGTRFRPKRPPSPGIRR